MLVSWMYVSRATYAQSDAAHHIESIEAVSARRNVDLGVSGTLVFARDRVAQYIEGPPAAVDLLRATIMRDTRHCDILTVMTDRLQDRRFVGWQVAYRGLATYVEKTIGSVQVQSIDGNGYAAGSLLRMLKQFSTLPLR